MSNSEIHDHCFNKNMQNEFLYLISQKVLKEVWKAKGKAIGTNTGESPGHHSQSQ